MHLSLEGNNNTTATANQNESPVVAAMEPPVHQVTDDPPIIDFSVPITQTYLNHMRSKGYMSDYSCHDEEL
nr:hypothetical protein BaRGS_023534 [Batillaria attramentaria]